MSQEIRSFRDLHAWKNAFELGIALYDATASFPERERFGLTNQIRRAAVAAPSDIADGYGRAGSVDYMRSLRMARGRLYDIETELLFAVRLGYLSEETYNGLRGRIEETEKVLAGLLRSIERSARSG